MKLPKYSPLSSWFNLPMVLSNQIFLPPSVEEPTSFWLILLIAYFDKILPFEVLDFIDIESKLYINSFFRALELWWRKTFTISDSLFGFAVIYFAIDLSLFFVFSLAFFCSASSFLSFSIFFFFVLVCQLGECYRWFQLCLKCKQQQ